QVISFLNLQRGGGKTTTVVNVATALTLRGSNVLAVDLDPEAMLMQRVRTSSGTRRERFASGSSVHTTSEGWDILPSEISTALLHTRALYRIVRQTAFFDEIRAVFDPYDFVLLDCSTLEMVVLIEALALSHDVIIPIDSESLQFFDGVERLTKLLGARATINPHIKVAGVFLARYAPRVRRAREMLTALFDALGYIYCFSAYLKDMDDIRQAEKRRVSVLKDSPTSRATYMYKMFVEQLTDNVIRRLSASSSEANEPPAPLAIESPVITIVQEPLAMPAPAPTAAAATLALASPVTPALAEPFALDTPVETPLEKSLVALYSSSNWLELARESNDMHQTMRYAMLALAQAPTDGEVVELFETRLTERIWSATPSDVDGMIALGRFLTAHGFPHYAAQMFRRATDLNPNAMTAWAGIAETTPNDAEKEHALQMCVQLEEGIAAAREPEFPHWLNALTALSNLDAVGT
ncbi:MAG TPA: AAA family ATPase, partial [Anaerolineae bacterium]|nr:AAA family ATPase [Anaerolineae bacterium]